MRSHPKMWQPLKLNVASWGDSSYDYYSPKPGVTNHTSPATFSISSLCSTTQHNSVFQPSPVPLSMYSMPAVGSVPPHLSSDTALISTAQLDIEIWLLFTQTRCFQPYLPCNILHLIISRYLHNQCWLAMCINVSVQFVISQTRCHSPCPPYQLLEVSHHTSTSL